MKPRLSHGQKAVKRQQRRVSQAGISGPAGRRRLREAGEPARGAHAADTGQRPGLPQLADVYQARTIGRILYYAKLRYLDEPRSVREILDLVDRDLSTEGLESLTRDLRGDLARPRRYEIAAALNRLDTFRVARTGG